VGSAFDAASQTLAAERGASEGGWDWGEAHAARFAHPVLSRLPLVGDRFVVTTPFGGNSTTVNVARNWHDRPAYHTVHAAGMRMIVDFSDLNGSLFIVTPGQSGHPHSVHFGDLAPLWGQGDYIQIRSDWSVSDPPQGASVLVLVP
jgi:penicillin amidase